MPPHCDTLDGPVVIAAKQALQRKNVNLILPYIDERYWEDEIKAYDKTIRVRAINDDARELADFWFFETSVRLHRMGEGAGYEGIKPAGLDSGPIIPLAEKAIETGNLEGLFKKMSSGLHDEMHRRFEKVLSLRAYDENDPHAGRQYVKHMLDFLVWAHHTYASFGKDPHGEDVEENEKSVQHKHEHSH